MNFHQHSTNNMLLGKPAGMTHDQCSTLPATMMVDEETGDATIASFWRPTEEELKLLNEGGSVVLYVYGSAHPVVSIGAVNKE